MRDALALYVKTPQLGRVKTRLAQVLGEHRALAAHCELAEDALLRYSGDAYIELSLWSTGANEVIEAWLQRFAVPHYQQAGRDLGERMFHTLVSLLKDHEAVALVGCDVMDIDAAYLRRALAATREHDVVLGPAHDGGYGLIATRRACESDFADIDWGTSTVLEQTLRGITSAGRSVKLMEPVWDVDRYEDWLRYCRVKSRGTERAGHSGG